MFDPYKTCRASTGAWSISGRASSPAYDLHAKSRSMSAWCQRAMPSMNWSIWPMTFSSGSSAAARRRSRARKAAMDVFERSQAVKLPCHPVPVHPCLVHLGHPSILGAIHRPLTDFHAVPIRRHFRCLGEQRSFESIAVVLNTLKLIFPSHHFRLSSSALASAGPITPSPKCSFNQSSNSY
jgi:hypothetical protein